jgi:hypothetical protein
MAPSEKQLGDIMKSADKSTLTLGKLSPEPKWAEVEMARIDRAMKESLVMFVTLIGFVGITLSWPLLA